MVLKPLYILTKPLNRSPARCGGAYFGEQMTKQQILPTVLIIIDIGAAVMYFPDDWRKVVYWCAAAALTYVVTF